MKPPIRLVYPKDCDLFPCLESPVPTSYGDPSLWNLIHKLPSGIIVDTNNRTNKSHMRVKVCIAKARVALHCILSILMLFQSV